MIALCRDCGRDFPTPEVERRCPYCDSPRVLEHPELAELAVAHIDCDAFYATVEKRDNPAIKDQPVVVGGRQRGVVMACCYIARRYGIRSAMPMTKALRLCPHATVVPPDMSKYARVGREVRQLLLETTPAVEPVSIDEAFLDLEGTTAIHGAYPAQVLVDLARKIERELAITISVGLSYNKFLAKVASDLEKPRGFAVIGRAKAQAFLTDQPLRLLWGVGPALERRLHRDGITRVGQLRDFGEAELIARYGSIGHRLHRFAFGRDFRRVHADHEAKSISAERTFAADLSGAEELEGRLWPLCERVAQQLRKERFLTTAVVLKLKTARFRLRTRRRHLARPTDLAADLFAVARELLRKEATGERFRLIGIGSADLVAIDRYDAADLFADDRHAKTKAIEGTVSALRSKFGDDAVTFGRSFRPKDD
ncbi:MAG: DNA polymerase IV [Alphaproteobacteria bacterium]|nr:DNA polymerase IV [Alphaproteobacteria bacterium]